jgi:hypothetical protein
MKHNIIPPLVPMAVDIALLNPDPKNARLHGERNIDEVVKSYAEHGQRKPIVVQRVSDKGTPMVVRAGNGQVEAAKKLGWTHIAAVVIDEKDRDAIRFAIRDNRTAELAEWNWQVIAEEAAAEELAGGRLQDLGWTDAEVIPLRQTTWFMEATGNLEEHQRAKPDPDDPDKAKEEVTITGKDAVAFIEAMTLMRERFGEPGMNAGHVIGRLARHYMATMNHSQAPTN